MHHSAGCPLLTPSRNLPLRSQIKLSNLGANAGLVHGSKVRTPLISSWCSDPVKAGVPLKLPAEELERLQQLFYHHCGTDGASSYLFMSRAQWLRMCGEAGLSGPETNAVELNLIFERAQLAAGAAAVPGVKLGMQQWLLALFLVAKVLLPEDTPEGAYRAVIDHVLQCAPAHLAGSDALAPMLWSDEVQDELDDARQALRPVFGFYVQEQE
jgi:hypothetical protein